MNKQHSGMNRNPPASRCFPGSARIRKRRWRVYRRRQDKTRQAGPASFLTTIEVTWIRIIPKADSVVRSDAQEEHLLMHKECTMPVIGGLMRAYQALAAKAIVESRVALTSNELSTRAHPICGVTRSMVRYVVNDAEQGALCSLEV